MQYLYLLLHRLLGDAPAVLAQLGEGRAGRPGEIPFMPELPKRLQVERKLACPHCGKLLPDFTRQEILEADEWPLRCAECRQVVELPAEYVERVRRQE